MKSRQNPVLYRLPGRKEAFTGLLFGEQSGLPFYYRNIVGVKLGLQFVKAMLDEERENFDVMLVPRQSARSHKGVIMEFKKARHQQPSMRISSGGGVVCNPAAASE